MNQHITLDRGVDHRHPDSSDQFSPPPGDPPPAESPADPPARRNRLALTATAFVAVGALGGLAGSQLTTDDASNIERPPAESASAECAPLWDQIRALDVPEPSWEAVATAMGLFPRGNWISADGLAWEHRDGRVIVVASPRSAAGAPGACVPPAATSDRSDS